VKAKSTTVLDTRTHPSDRAPLLQRAVARAASKIPSIDHESLQSSGTPLETHSKAFFEARFGQDFSQVRLHTDAQADETVNRHDALALTVGSQVFFGSSVQPRSVPAQLVLAHEMAHVAQNQSRTAPQGNTQALEQEATIASTNALAGKPARVQQAAGHTPLALGKGWKYLLAGLAGAALGGLGGLGLAALGVGLGGLGILGLAAAGAGAGLFFNYQKEKDAQRLRQDLTQMDTWITGSYGSDLPNLLGADQALKAHWKIVSEREFEYTYNDWPARDQNAPYTKIGGFVDRRISPPTIWIRAYTNNAFVRLHEAVHLYSQPAIRSTNHNLREGTTDYFARQIAQRERIEVTSNYEREFKVVNNLVARLGATGEELLRRAYFRGELGQLAQAATAAGLDWERDVEQGGLADRNAAPSPQTPSPAPVGAATPAE
jgi:Domain of unknown function (DUF4157)